MANASLPKDNGRNIYVTPRGCQVCDGRLAAYTAFGEWPCPKCHTSNRPQNAFCHQGSGTAKPCGGKPTREYMAKQSTAQAQFYALPKFGQAPYAGGGKAAGKGRKGAAGNGGGGKGNGGGTNVSKQILALKEKCKTFEKKA